MLSFPTNFTVVTLGKHIAKRKIYENKGFRLCTVSEVQATKPAGTGCGFDNREFGRLRMVKMATRMLLRGQDC